MKKCIADEEIADIFEEELEYVIKIRNILEQSPGITSYEIVKKLRENINV